MKIVFAGTPEPAAVALEHLIADERIEVVAVVTQPDAKRGRGRSLRPSKVAEVAEKAAIPTYKWPSLKAGTESGDEARAVLSNLAERGVSATAVVAYGNLIPTDLLDVFEHGWVNLHYSLLPRWRGAAPVQAALAAGDEYTGASIFRIEQGLDTGPVAAQLTQKIAIEDTADDLLASLTYAGRELLADALIEMDDGSAELSAQDDEAATHAPKIHPADAQIDWKQPAEVIQRTARAHTPAPGAWTLLDDQRFKIGMLLPTSPTDASELAELGAGEVVASNKKVFVGTGTSALEITLIQPPGKKMMDAAAWARGQQKLLAKHPTFSARNTEAETGE